MDYYEMTLPQLFVKLGSVLSDAEEITDAINQKMLPGEQKMSHGEAPAQLPENWNSESGILKKHPKKKNPKKITARSPEPEATSLVIHRLSDGSADVTIDDGETIRLTRTLAELLSILSEGDGQTSDGLPAWKSLDEIGQELSEALGRTVKRKAVIQNRYLLRTKLKSKGLKPRLIQTNRVAGYRFAIQRRRIKVAENLPGSVLDFH